MSPTCGLRRSICIAARTAIRIGIGIFGVSKGGGLALIAAAEDPLHSLRGHRRRLRHVHDDDPVHAPLGATFT